MPARKRKRKGKKSLAAQVRSNKAVLDGLRSGTEKKYRTQVSGNYDVNTTATVIPLTGLGQGNTRITRMGTQAQLRKIFIRGYISNTHGTPQDCLVRLMIFKVEQPNLTLPVMTAILESFDINGLTNLNNMDNHQIVYDHTFAMDTSLHSVIPFKWSKVFNHKMTYINANTSDETGMEEHHYYMIIFSDVAGTTNDPLANWQWRVTFADS